jgi:hypothetical protein
LTPDQIRAWVAAASQRTAEHEEERVAGGTAELIIILGEIAAQLAEGNAIQKNLVLARLKDVEPSTEKENKL